MPLFDDALAKVSESSIFVATYDKRSYNYIINDIVTKTDCQEHVGYCFYERDKMKADRLWLSYGALKWNKTRDNDITSHLSGQRTAEIIGSRIIQIMAEFGFECVWNGEASQSIEINFGKWWNTQSTKRGG